MSDIFQEVQEEYRREQLAQAWTKYRVPIVASAVALVVAVAGYQGWTYWHDSMVANSSREFEVASQLMATPQTAAQAIPAFAKLGKEGWGGYPVVANFQEAAARAGSGDVKGAIALYDRIAADGTGGALFSDYARVRASILLVDTAPLGEIEKRLKDVAGSTSPWRISAEELLAYAYWRAGNKTEASRLLELIKANPLATSGAKQRATQFAAMIAAGLKVADLKKPAAAPAPALDMPLFPARPDINAMPTEAPAPDAPSPPAAPTPAAPGAPTNTPAPTTPPSPTP